jgi:hypothetical protein
VSIIDTMAIPTAQRTGLAGWVAIPIPDGSTSFRVEPAVVASDWAAGMIVHIVVNIVKGGVTIESHATNLSTSLDRTGAIATPYLEINCPLDPTGAPIPYVGCSISGTILANRSTTIGLRLCAAPDPTQLPATLAAPV